MNSRRRFFYKCCAAVLVLLAASPVTAPFSTYQFNEHGQPATGPAMGDVKAKGFSDPTVDSPAGFSILSPLLSAVARVTLASGADVVARAILRPVLRI